MGSSVFYLNKLTPANESVLLVTVPSFPRSRCPKENPEVGADTGSKCLLLGHFTKAKRGEEDQS